MDNIVNHLVELSNSLDKEGKKVCADAVDSLIQNGSVVKIAQYVGVIGYVLKQNRAMANCVRRKRVASDASMQDVVLSCLKEYQDGQDYNDKEWTSKYAQVLQHDPSLFKQAHLVFLAEWGKESDIEGHITNLEKAAGLLQEHEANDEMISKMLSHIKSYGDVLQEETSNINFKVAAPRGWWSRLWQNINPWSKKWRERGEDKQTVSEMNNILKRIIEVGDTTKQMQNSIQQLKSRFGSLADVIPQGPSHEILSRINGLSTGDWNNLSSSIHQLQYLLQSTPPTSPQEQNMIYTAHGFVGELSENVNVINDSMRDIQINMNLLRQRSPIRGRYSKYTEEGDIDPRAITSPSEEFGVLDRVLSRLYTNPFDQEAYFYAQRMHARLEDKLRYIESEPDEGVENWLQTPETPETPDMQSVIPQTQDTGHFDEKRVQHVVQSLLQKPIDAGSSLREKADWLADIFTEVFAGLGLRDHPKLRSLKDTLIEVAKRGPAQASQGVEEPLTPVETAPVETKSATQTGDWAENARAQWGPPTATEDAWADLLGEEPGKHQASVGDLLRIATEIDPIDRSLADLIDKYIAEKDLFELPEFPEHASVIKYDSKKETPNPSNTQKKAGHVPSIA